MRFEGISVQSSRLAEGWQPAWHSKTSAPPSEAAREPDMEDEKCPFGDI